MRVMYTPRRLWNQFEEPIDSRVGLRWQYMIYYNLFGRISQQFGGA